jgi:PAS domain S-box-containing protein
MNKKNTNPKYGVSSRNFKKDRIKTGDPEHDEKIRMENLDQEEILSLARFPSENPFPVLRVSHDGILMYANNASKPLISLWNITPGNMVPETIGRLIPGIITDMKTRLIEIECNDLIYSLHIVPIENEDYVNLYGRNITESRKAEEALKESQDLYMELVTNARTIILKLDKEGKITFFNEFAQNFFGYSEKEIIGKKTIGTIVPDIDSAGKHLDEMIEDIIENPDKYSININENIKKNGEKVWVEWHNKALFNKDGTRAGHVAIGIDITDRIKAQNELRDSKEKLEFSLDSGNIGIWEWDLKTNEVNLDARMEKMFGLQAGEFEKTYNAFESLVHEEDLSHIQKAIRNSLEKSLPLETVFRLRSKSQKTKFISAKGFLNNDIKGNHVSFTGVCIDVTGLQEGTERLISKLNEELLRSNKELESFAYIASHDLQEPLRMVTSFTQLLSLQYSDKLDGRAQEYINYAVDGSKRMYDLLNSLLAYSRIQTKGKSFHRVELLQVLETTKKNLALKIRERDAVIKYDGLPVVFADEGQMIQLFQNLITNSIKFCNKPPRINISSEDIGDHYIISIGDNGIGIESQYFDRIFVIFQRLFPKGGEYEGTGIGLAICRRIVERHGGKIWVESEPGKGSAFMFTIPKSDSE